MQKAPQRPAIVFNLSRIGKKGTGQVVFVKQIIECMRGIFQGECIAFGGSIENLPGMQHISLPNWVKLTQHVSKIRPLLWMFYIIVILPKKKAIISPMNRVLSLTHHALPYCHHQILSLLDIRPYFYPDSFLQKIYFRKMLPRIIKRMDGILTISQESKRLIVSVYKVQPERVFVIPLFIDLKIFESGSSGSLCTEKYLLMIGATWKHKNAHEVLAHHNLWANKYRLKIVGSPSSYLQHLQILVKTYNIFDRVEFYNSVSFKELLSLYQNASALIFPSIMEGFGLPPLEAMACATPIIASSIPVVKEICGEAPIYIKLGELSSWKRAFSELDKDILVKEKIQIGLLKAREYNRERTENALRTALLAIWPELKIEIQEKQ